MDEPSGGEIRTHPSLPAHLVSEVDACVGARQRSEFIAEAIQEKLRDDALDRAIEDVIAHPSPTIPEWATTELAVEWVRAIRGHGSPPPTDPTP